MFRARTSASKLAACSFFSSTSRPSFTSACSVSRIFKGWNSHLNETAFLFVRRALNPLTSSPLVSPEIHAAFSFPTSRPRYAGHDLTTLYRSSWKERFRPPQFHGLFAFLATRLIGAIRIGSMVGQQPR